MDIFTGRQSESDTRLSPSPGEPLAAVAACLPIPSLLQQLLSTARGAPAVSLGCSTLLKHFCFPRCNKTIRSFFSFSWET